MDSIAQMCDGASMKGMVKQALAVGSAKCPAGSAAEALAKCAEYDAAVAYDVGFIKRARQLGLSAEEADAMYAIARQRAQA